MNISIPAKNIDEGKLVAIGIIGGLAILVLFFVFISGGLVRHVPITWKEKIETTIAFRMIDGKLNVRSASLNTHFSNDCYRCIAQSLIFAIG